MKIAKPLLLVTTPIGLAGGLYEAFQLAGGLAFIMLALVAIIGAAMGMLIMTVRRERAAELAREAHEAPPSSTTPEVPMKIFIVITLIAIVVSLGQALFAMSGGPTDDKRMVRALTVRVALSVGLFVMLLVGWATGGITPHGL